MGVVVGRGREIEFGLKNGDFDAIRRSWRTQFSRRANEMLRGLGRFAAQIRIVMRLALERQRRLGFVGQVAPAAGAIDLHAAGNLDTPVRFYLGCRDGRVFFFCGSRVKGCVTERAFNGVFEQKSATLRAFVYHQSVLRCGRSR